MKKEHEDDVLHPDGKLYYKYIDGGFVREKARELYA